MKDGPRLLWTVRRWEFHLEGADEESHRTGTSILDILNGENAGYAGQMCTEHRARFRGVHDVQPGQEDLGLVVSDDSERGRMRVGFICDFVEMLPEEEIRLVFDERRFGESERDEGIHIVIDAFLCESDNPK